MAQAAELALILLLPLANLLLHLFHLLVDVLVHLELLELLLVSLLHRLVPVIARLAVDQRVHVEIVLVVTDQDSVTVLELVWILKQFTVHLNFKLARVIVVGHECGRPIVTVEVQAALLVSDTDTLDGDFGRVARADLPRVFPGLGLLPGELLADLARVFLRVLLQPFAFSP